MKVLMINIVCGVRSTGRICTDIAQVLEKQGHEVKIAYGRETVPKKYQKYAYRIGSDLDVKFHATAARLFDCAGLGSSVSTKRLVKWIEEYDPDIIHLHNIHGYYVNYKVLFDYLRTCGKKIIWTLHDCWAFTGHCSHFSLVGCEKWKTQCDNCPQKKNYPTSLLLDCSKKNYSLKKAVFTDVPNMHITTPSYWLAGLVKKSFMKDYPVECVYNGIDLSIFHPVRSDFKVKYGLAGKRMILGVATAWTSSKGLQDFIELSKMLDEKSKIVLVGLSEEQIKKLPDSILGLPITNSVEELAMIYTSADVFVNPSREETMGLTTAEALACGTPVITYNQTAVPEVPDDKCGIVVECNAFQILKALQNLDFESEDCIRRASMFEKNAQYEKIVSIYMQ